MQFPAYGVQLYFSNLRWKSDSVESGTFRCPDGAEGWYRALGCNQPRAPRQEVSEIQ